MARSSSSSARTARENRRCSTPWPARSSSTAGTIALAGARRHALARAPAGQLHRPGVPEPVQRHRAEDDRSPRTSRWPRAAGGRRGLGWALHRAIARRDARACRAAEHGPGGPAGQRHRQPVGRPAAGAHAADGDLAANRAAAAGRAHRRARPEERRPGDRADRRDLSRATADHADGHALDAAGRRTSATGSS